MPTVSDMAYIQTDYATTNTVCLQDFTKCLNTKIYFLDRQS